MLLADSHCHLHLIKEKLSTLDIAEMIMQARNNHIAYILNVCTKLEELTVILQLCEAYDDVWGSIGVHPNETHEDDNLIETLLNQAKHDKIVAIGETGLDYYRSTGDLTWQQNRFRKHIQVALELKKPLIIHTRQAKDDTLAIMKEEGVEKVGGVMHCFSEDWDMAKQALDLGFYISFSGVVTFKNAENLREVARKVPDDRILIETDAPYLAPTPMRGKTNEPAYLLHTATFLSQLRQTPLEQFAQLTTNNFFNLFTMAHNSYV